MKNYHEIKLRIEDCYAIIETANLEIKKIRNSVCDHPEEFFKVVDYTTRPGQTFSDRTICGICGELMFGLTHFKES